MKPTKHQRSVLELLARKRTKPFVIAESVTGQVWVAEGFLPSLPLMRRTLEAMRENGWLDEVEPSPVVPRFNHDDTHYTISAAGTRVLRRPGRGER